MGRSGDKKNYATVYDVAERAGVSRTTVSRVFLPEWAGRVKAETAEKVLQAARELHYTPNAIARSLTNQQSNTIAIVVNARPGIFISNMLLRMVRSIQQTGRQTLVLTVDYHDDMEKIADQVRHQRVDAVIVTSAVLPLDAAGYFEGTQIPVILFEYMHQNPAMNSVWCDESGGTSKAAAWLLETGHRNIGVIYNPLGPHRYNGFVERLRKDGLEPAAVSIGDYSFEAGYRLAAEMKRTHPDLDAIFCDEDTMALGAMDALRHELGLRVPEDVSVIGFDDIITASLPSYSLTTLAHPIAAMIEALTEGIDSQLANDDVPFRRSFEMKLVKRGSVADRR